MHIPTMKTVPNFALFWHFFDVWKEKKTYYRLPLHRRSRGKYGLLLLLLIPPQKLDGSMLQQFILIQWQSKWAQDAQRGILINQKSKISCQAFTVRVVKHWNKLPRKTVDAPFLELFKASLDGALSNLMQLKGVPVHDRRVET